MRKALFLGASTGAMASVGMIGWALRGPAKVAATSQESIGFQMEAMPTLGLKPEPVDDLARKLGYTNGPQALKEASVLSDRIKQGVLPTGWLERCPQEHSGQLCSIVQDYLGPKLLPALPGTGKVRVRYRKIYSFVPKNVPLLHKENFNEQVRRIPDWTLRQIEPLAAAALKVEPCPHNFSLSLARKLEMHLRQPEAWALMDKLDEHGAACIQLEDSFAEFVYQRIAFFKMGRKQYKEAIPFLEKALQVNGRKEEYRSLFWLSEARKALGLDKEALAARQALWKSYPLSWHSIMSRVQSGGDPLEAIQSRTLYSDEYTSGDKALDQRVLWLQLLMALDQNAFVIRHYGEFIVKSFNPDISPGFVQHLARLFNGAALYRLQILALSQIVYARPEVVTFETLRLLFPRPYFEDFQSHAKLDTSLLLGLARQESGFDPGATSNANARGLLQLLPSTARTLQKKKAKKLYDYSDNIDLGALYLLKLIRYFDGSVEKTLAAYNAGQTIVGKWSDRYDFTSDPMLFLDLVPYRETRDYVPAILRNAYWYHRLFPELTKALTADVTTSELLRKQILPPQRQQADGKNTKNN